MLLMTMEKEKPYLHASLTMNDLADQLGVLNKTLSQVVNEKSGGNFSRFVNKYRINEFKERVKEEGNRQYTLEAIAKDCGFATKTSFHTAFKREESITPAAYLKSNQPVMME